MDSAPVTLPSEPLACKPMRFDAKWPVPVPRLQNALTVSVQPRTLGTVPNARIEARLLVAATGFGYRLSSVVNAGRKWSL